MVKYHSVRGNPLPPHGLLFLINSKGSYLCIIPQTRHTTAFVTAVVKHWYEQEIAQWVHYEGSIRRPIEHHERTLLPRLFIDARRALGIKEMFYLTPHSTHFIYSYIRPMVKNHLDSGLGNHYRGYFSISNKGSFALTLLDRIAHTMGFRYTSNGSLGQK